MVAMFPLIRKISLKMYNKILMRNMKKNLLFILGAAAIMASCSNNEFVDQQQPEVNVPESDVEVAIGAQSVTVTQTRAALDAWDNTPIYVWGLAKNSNNWTDATSKLFSTGHVKGTVSNGGNVVTLGEKPEDVYFYPLNSSVNFSFYACSPIPDNAPSLLSNRVVASYQIKGNNDILWGGAEAKDIDADDGNTYSGYNARYFRKGGVKPTLKFDHKLTRLNFTAKKGQENNDGSIIPVKIENITITANNNATMTVAGDNAGSLTAVSGTAELPVFFGDETFEKRGALNLAEDFSESPAGTVMVLPKTGSYIITVSLSAEIDGKPVMAEPSTFEISYTDKKTGVTSFDAGKAYTIRLTVYGLRKVEFEKATLTPWDTDTEFIDQEVN